MHNSDNYHKTINRNGDIKCNNLKNLYQFLLWSLNEEDIVIIGHLIVIIFGLKVVWFQVF